MYRKRILSALVAVAAISAVPSSQQSGPNPPTPGTRPSPSANPVQHSNPIPFPKPANLILNEVLFDQTGRDTNATTGTEYVELYATKQALLSKFTLTDNLGNAFPALPNVTVPPGSIVLLILGGGSNAYDPDPDITDGFASYMLGLTPGDYLDNHSGGVRLVNGSGKVVDHVYWGMGSAPTGSRGDFLDISFASGTPMNEGDSIGRPANPTQGFTGKASDWARNGGANAAGSTPNGVNKPDAWMSSASLLKWAQSGMNRIVVALSSQTQQGWFSIVGSSVSNVQVIPITKGLSVTADHTFNVLQWGVATTLSGSIQIDYSFDDSPGKVSWTRSAKGSLVSPAGFGFDIDHTQAVSGLHTNTITGVFTTNTVYNEGTSAYPYSVSSVNTLLRTGDDSWTSTENRTCVDYGGAGPKQSSRVMQLTRDADGLYTSSTTIDRDYPIAPPVPGTTDSILYQEHKDIDTVCTMLDDWGQFSSLVTRYDVYSDSALLTSLQSGATGSVSLTFNPVSQSEPLGSADYFLQLPVSQGGNDMTITGTLHGRTDHVGSAILFTLNGQIDIDGSVMDSFTQVIDPPIQEAVSGSSKDDGGFLDAVADCATTGAGVGGAAGSVAGGVAGAVGGAAVGAAVGAVGGPPGMVLAGEAGGVGGAAVGTTLGAAVGAAAGTGIGGISCGIGYLWDKIF